MGYASVNMASHEVAAFASKKLSGLTVWSCQPDALTVTWNEPIQGLAELVRRYRNSPLMHPEVPSKFMPMMFRHGSQRAFPGPTKKLKKPRMRNARCC